MSVTTSRHRRERTAPRHRAEPEPSQLARKVGMTTGATLVLVGTGVAFGVNPAAANACPANTYCLDATTNQNVPSSPNTGKPISEIYTAGQTNQTATDKMIADQQARDAAYLKQLEEQRIANDAFSAAIAANSNSGTTTTTPPPQTTEVAIRPGVTIQEPSQSAPPASSPPAADAATTITTPQIVNGWGPWTHIEAGGTNGNGKPDYKVSPSASDNSNLNDPNSVIGERTCASRQTYANIVDAKGKQKLGMLVVTANDLCVDGRGNRLMQPDGKPPAAFTANVINQTGEDNRRLTAEVGNCRYVGGGASGEAGSGFTCDITIVDTYNGGGSAGVNVGVVGGAGGSARATVERVTVTPPAFLTNYIAGAVDSGN